MLTNFAKLLQLGHLLSADISAGISRDATTVINNGKENKPYAGQDFDDA